VSNPESFIAEVSEELRRDRLYAMFRKWGWLAALLIVLVVGTAAWREWSSSNRQMQAENFGDALLAIESIDSLQARSDAFVDLYNSGIGPDARAIAGIYEAGLLQQDGDTAGALKALNGVLSYAGVSEIYRELALLKTVVFSADQSSEGDVLTALEQLTVPGRPFRLLALELKAQYLLGDSQSESSQVDEAVDILQTLLEDARLPDNQAERIGLLLTSIGRSTTDGTADEE